MVTAVTLALSPRAPIHRIEAPRPVEIALPPASVAGTGKAEGASAPRPEGALTSPLLGIDPSWIRGGAAALAEAKAAGAYGLASMPEVATLTPTAPRFAYEEVAALGYVPGGVMGDAASLIAYVREEIANGRAAARLERELSAEAGVAVRLAYDPNTDSAVALYPGDEGYDRVRGAEAAFSRMRWDLERMGLDVRAFADLLTI